MRKLVLLAAAVSAVLLPAGAGDVVELIVAKVNGDIVTRSELERTRKQMVAEMTARGATPAQLKEVMAQRDNDILRERIDQLLLIQKGKELNINVDAEITKWLGQMQAEAKIADPEKFQQYVREQTGMSFEDFKAEARNNMTTQRVVGMEVYSKINIPKAEVEKYYAEHQKEFIREERLFLREILVAVKDGVTLEAAEKKAKDLVARAKKGEKFNELARDNSDANTAQQGGDIGGFNKGMLRKEIEDLVWDKARNFVTDPIKLDNGFLILRVEEHHKQGQASIDEMENEIREKLFAPRAQPKVREFLTQLRMDAFLEIRDGFADTGAAPGKDTRWTDPAMLRPETVTKEEVAEQTRLRRLLWAFPIPGTKAAYTGKSASR
jgi:parvulin-like peptidyl-prolyl isomerase